MNKYEGHTPGPWTYQEARDARDWPTVRRGDQGGFRVMGLTAQQADADARLLADAPTLLRELTTANIENRAYQVTIENLRSEVDTLRGQLCEHHGLSLGVAECENPEWEADREALKRYKMMCEEAVAAVEVLRSCVGTLVIRDSEVARLEGIADAVVDRYRGM